MADRAKEESKMKLRIVSKPFDGYMSPARKSPGTNTSTNGGSSSGGGCCCCCFIVLMTAE
ncbi:MAG: hypothetical protein OXC80_03830 [Gammaproteobacteria bacterium]|nr:hypothetical protein [Gammaproteobacteria bacterium]